MNLQKQILFSALLLAFTAVSASAAPAPEMVPQEKQEMAVAQPTDVFGASVLSQSGDCAAAAGPRAVSLDPSQCGSCSPVACRLQFVNSSCGSGAGGIKYCRDWSGLLCTDGGSRCQCTNSIPPM